MNRIGYEEEFRDEYHRIRRKVTELHEMLAKYEAGTLDHALTCSPSLLKKQLSAMEKYLYCLEVRSHVEKINL